jgi:N-acetyl-gamma-glutamyl-phosphate reductase common form
MLNVAIYGASGYGGVELLRLLLAHPDVRVVQATSREPGRRVDDVHPGLRGLTDLALDESKPDALHPDLDAVFFALPHGESAAVVDTVSKRCPNARLIDLAQDFRTGCEAAGWVYGQPELFREQIAAARKIACPGCFATAILLGVGPALAAGVAIERVIVDAKTGSSGSGAAAQSLTHHPTRVATHKAYKVFEHQHEKEVHAAWSRIPRDKNRGGDLPSLAFVPQSTPLVRGIYACCYLIPRGGAASIDLSAAYRDLFRGSPFVRVLNEPPNVAHVRGTNNAELYIREHAGLWLVISSIDNLVRGASGQAVQCLNLAFGLPEDRGLRLAALVP